MHQGTGASRFLINIISLECAGLIAVLSVLRILREFSKDSKDERKLPQLIRKNVNDEKNLY